MPFGRDIHKWEDNIKTDLEEIACKGMDSPYLLQDKAS
jgi:hypothetical protein